MLETALALGLLRVGFGTVESWSLAFVVLAMSVVAQAAALSTVRLVAAWMKGAAWET